ncbi:Secretion protein snm4 [Carbonactinospora thermoautotrophica]|uniref:Secretion protein snm4 n=1 Tax=Carbonactinospora thermoautotrophica TaxID=1469144 RepID=A0A132MPC4_9ACTN|nr:type VII secretion integral membrane protein EccD [Carbonactinospora thermoautotrophica]KWW99717.1 Secretion protein snm4 [Carbonactinospora thermoautotrophica]
MSASVMTGFCRVTIVAPHIRVDVALPEDVPLSEIMPDIVRLTDQTQSAEAHRGFNLSRFGQDPLDPALSLAAQGVRNGEILYLRSKAEQQPPIVYDDVVEAIAGAVESNSRLWNDRMLRAVALSGAALFMYLSAFVLWRAGSGGDIHGVPAILAGVMAIVLLSVGAARALVYDDHVSGAVVCAGALPHAFVAGLGILPVQEGFGPGRGHFTTASVTLLVAAVIAALLLPYRDAIFFSAALASVIGMVSGLIALFTEASVTKVAAVTATLALALIGFLPGLAARWAKIPDTFTVPEASDEPDEEVDVALIKAQANRGHEVLVGLVGACVLVLVVSLGILGFSNDLWARILTAVIAVAMFGRARIFRQATEVILLAGGGVVGLLLLELGLTLSASNSNLDRTTWIFGTTAVAAVLFALVGITLPGRQISPFWGRAMEIFEGVVLASVVPLCVAVLRMHDWARSGFGLF